MHAARPPETRRSLTGAAWRIYPEAGSDAPLRYGQAEGWAGGNGGREGGWGDELPNITSRGSISCKLDEEVADNPKLRGAAQRRVLAL
jgi:hypothetical protein